MTAPSNAIDWSWRALRSNPGAYFGRTLLLLLRTLYGVFWLMAGINKVRSDWLTSDVLERIYRQRVTELEPGSLAVAYLEHFGIPFHKLIAWTLASLELAVGLGLLLGLCTRWSAGAALFVLFNLSIGGYYDASLIPFYLLGIAFLLLPAGRYPGLDRWLSRA